MANHLPHRLLGLGQAVDQVEAVDLLNDRERTALDLNHSTGGVHNDGLVHVSQMSNRYIQDPR